MTLDDGDLFIYGDEGLSAGRNNENYKVSSKKPESERESRKRGRPRKT